MAYEIPGFDKKLFFSRLRTIMGGHITQGQVVGAETIIDYWHRAHGQDSRQLAYILATAMHECRFILSIKEVGRGKGKKYGIPHPNGQTYYGRGAVQLTWYDNYLKMSRLLGVDLVHDPDKACDPYYSCLIMLEGMYKGISGKGDFTGHHLDQYFNATTDDPYNARTIVNGHDRADLIKRYYMQINAALREAGMNPQLLGVGASIIINDILPKVLGQLGQSPPVVEEVKKKVEEQAKETIPSQAQPKSPVSSTGVWGGAASLIAGIVTILGSLSPDDWTHIASVWQLLTGLVASAGGVGAIYGRIKATKVIG